MKVAIYTRASSKDKGQDVENQRRFRHAGRPARAPRKDAACEEGAAPNWADMADPFAGE